VVVLDVRRRLVARLAVGRTRHADAFLFVAELPQLRRIRRD
jgi:hypothetical protein